MPLCGFDKQMLEGLGKFYKGLAETVIRKSKEKNTTIEEVITLELKDMDDFLKELTALKNELNRYKLQGITNYAKTFYLGALKQTKEESISIEEAMENQIKETKHFLSSIDNHYYKHLESKKEKPIAELVRWIQEEFN